MPERADEAEEETKVDEMIKKEIAHQEDEATRLVNEELALSGTDGIDVLADRKNDNEEVDDDPEAYVGDQAYQMY